MAKDENKIEVEGIVVEVKKGGTYKVKIDINGNEFIVEEAYPSGKMRTNMIRILPGDKVTLELSPTDLTKGRITWNKR